MITIINNNNNITPLHSYMISKKLPSRSTKTGTN